ncbi:MAG TPA: hypothetical protein PL011_09210, partial [Kiritimatiellia bacterium]|nr:hypothetical protein [Kiritimatiellia bacterium]HRX07072.1 hypothetical protein [Kiritimatiellia bacterium]
PFFPRHGNFFSGFSTLWKIFFHTMENLPGPLSAGLPRHGRERGSRGFRWDFAGISRKNNRRIFR